ncbi:ADIPOR-like receptor SPBC12C2.09c [Fusarium oxysporum f. sp. albedinis]|nr:ADIPOR-like receptor SPBC12C2.09c [Fusarium oxysporum f. sp. albedinis]
MMSNQLFQFSIVSALIDGVASQGLPIRCRLSDDSGWISVRYRKYSIWQNGYPLCHDYTLSTLRHGQFMETSRASSYEPLADSKQAGDQFNSINFALAWRCVDSLLSIWPVELNHRICKLNWWR